MSSSEEIEKSVSVSETSPKEKIIPQAEGESSSAEELSSARETSSQCDRDELVSNGDSNQTVEHGLARSPRPVRTRRAPKRYGDYVIR